jgi:hypothetical protein
MKLSIVIVALAGLLLGGASRAWAAEVSNEELAEIKALLTEQQTMIRALKSRVDELEGQSQEGQSEPLPAVSTPPTRRVETFGEASTEDTGEEVAPGGGDVPPSPLEDVEEEIRRGQRAPVVYRRALNDRQAAAARAGDYTLDPDFRGFIPIPNTALMIKFNAKPRVDFIGDSANPGTDFRFVPAKFPESTEAGWQFSANANGSQVIVDVRAPSIEGTPRFYYQNDFFGSNDSNMNYRLQHLYGEYAGFLTGFTFGVFEDPDAWPNTVDYEGPNSVIFARRAVGQYTAEFTEDWELTLSVEDPDIFVDTTGDPDAKQRSRAPDTGFAIRWTPGDLGHVRASTIFRSIAVDGGDFGNDDVFGWGINTSGNLHLTDSDDLQFWFVYGEGVGGMGNDTSFLKSDAAFNSNGNLNALEYWSTMIALTHFWAPQWSSTMTHGYVSLENTFEQTGDAYDESHYASVNLVYQLFKRMRIGVEALYGNKNVKDGRDADVFRVQMGVAFSLFD